ncbi:MAG: hypothetical protein Q7S00_08030, partial [bacterium]|nr:hypothetical protein [bacterium]
MGSPLPRFSVFLFLFLGTLAGCGSTSTPAASSGSCASGSHDFYVVENAQCAAASGKLSRVNPDVPCKKEVLTGLNCPIDFVFSTVDDGIGYLSSRTDGIYQVNVTAETKTLIVTDTNIISPAGLFLLEDLTTIENDEICGGNTLTDAVLLIADEGTTDDGGMVWRWCLITDDPAILSGGNHPSPVSEISPSQIKHPR